MRIIFKIIAAPFVVVLTVAWAMLTFLFCWAEKIMQIAAGLIMLIAIAMFIMGRTTNGIILAVIAFLISPLGIPAIAQWLIEKLYGLNDALRDFITS